MNDFMKVHTAKLTTTWFLGVLTWMSEATTIVGLLGAIVGFVAGVMLVIIRWDDFWNCKVMCRLRRVKYQAKKVPNVLGEAFDSE